MASTRKNSIAWRVIVPFGLGVVVLMVVALRFGWARATYKHFVRWSVQSRAVFDSHNFGASIPYQPVKTKTSLADGMVQVYIPEGIFTMGSNAADMPKSYPEHRVSLNAYWMDQMEVTNGMFALCVDAGVCRSLRYPAGKIRYLDDPGYENYPVVYVTWFDAQTYCAWAGRRLPTEAEWEKAARGTDGRLYPWGNTLPDGRLANFDHSIDVPLPVDRYLLGASPFGVLNMAGNVREWVADWFNESYYRRSPSANPAGSPVGKHRSLRGGSFLDDARELLVFNRFEHAPDSPGINRGFRCAESDPYHE